MFWKNRNKRNKINAHLEIESFKKVSGLVSKATLRRSIQLQQQQQPNFLPTEILQTPGHFSSAQLHYSYLVPPGLCEYQYYKGAWTLIQHINTGEIIRQSGQIGEWQALRHIVLDQQLRVTKFRFRNKHLGAGRQPRATDCAWTETGCVTYCPETR